eukprot:6185306-Pleurochrysis_carterae.AAC.1
MSREGTQERDDSQNEWTGRQRYWEKLVQVGVGMNGQNDGQGGRGQEGQRERGTKGAGTGEGGEYDEAAKAKIGETRGRSGEGAGVRERG